MTDTSILADAIHEDPLTVMTTITVDGNSDSDQDVVSEVGLVNIVTEESSISDNRAVKIDRMEPGDYALLVVMWACFALAFFSSVSVCVVLGCRRGLVK